MEKSLEFEIPTTLKYEQARANLPDVLRALALGARTKDLTGSPALELSQSLQERAVDGTPGASLAIEAMNARRDRPPTSMLTFPWTNQDNRNKIIALRDLVMGTAGLYLAQGQETVGVVKMLNPVPIADDLGVTRLVGRGPQVFFPYWKTDPTGGWQSDETAGPSEDTPQVGKVSSTMCTFIVVVDVARSLLVKHPETAASVIALLADKSLREESRVLISGSGASGEPPGILTFSIGTGTGASLTWANFQDAVINKLLAQNVPIENIKGIGAADASHIGRTRVREAGSGRYLIEGNKACDIVPWITTGHIANGKILTGDFREAHIVYYGPGFNILVNPYSQSNSGVVRFVSFLSLDNQVPNPLAFCQTSSIT